jgi:UDP-N-acetylmuramoyl-L-alanyl-D-glutamate--2,6-diaminopimelate ligase
LIERALRALDTLPRIPGRMQTVRLTNGTTVIVDHAHSTDSPEKVLHTLRDVLANGRLITWRGRRGACARPCLRLRR